MRALTLWQPWASVVAAGVKLIENRPWKPWGYIIGQRIAIHAGRHWDAPGALSIAERGGGAFVREREPEGAILATCIVTGYLEKGDLLARPPAGQEVWFTGPFGWLLADMRRLAVPVPCRGAQSLWVVPDDVLARIQAQELGVEQAAR